MSERIDDPNFSDYSWLDDEKRLHDASATPPTFQDNVEGSENPGDARPMPTEEASEAELMNRGQQRADFARSELASNPEKWAEGPRWSFKSYPKCNEFVYEAHLAGDPLGAGFPTVLRDRNPGNPFRRDYFKPTVDNIADPEFAPSTLEYHDDVNLAKPGDIVVWYGNGNHHSAIATGDGKVIYAGHEGLKENTIRSASESFPGATPIIRRYK